MPPKMNAKTEKEHLNVKLFKLAENLSSKHFY